MNESGRDGCYFALLFGLAISLPVSGAVAQETDAGTQQELFVTGSHSPRSAALIPASTSVYDAETIEASQAMGLTEFLRFIPGVHVVQEGARGGHTALYMRGLGPNHVAVMVDGIRLNDPSVSLVGRFDPTTLALLDIERIEVVRGPSSAVHGSDAMAGAINIITRRTGPDEDPSFSISGTGGRFDAWAAGGRMSAGLGFAGVSVAGSFATNGDPHSPSEYQGGNLKATLDAELAGNTKLRASLRFSDSKSESFPEHRGGGRISAVGPGFPFPVNLLEERDGREISGGFQINQSTNEWLDLELLASHVHRREKQDTPGGFGARAQSKIEWSRTNLSASARIRPLDSLDITLGGDVYREDGKVDTTISFLPGFSRGFDTDRLVPGFFAEGQYRSPMGLTVSASFRGDFPEKADVEWSRAVGATLKIPRTPLTINGGWSEGYRLPSFFDLSNPDSSNPKLRSERSRGWEIGLHADLLGGKLSSRVTYFDIQVKDIVRETRLLTFFPQFIYHRLLLNHSDMSSHGIEFEVEMPVSDRLRFGASATYNPTNLRKGPGRVFFARSERLTRRPRWRGELHASAKPTDSIELGMRVLFVDDSLDFSNATGRYRTLDDYMKVDITASWQIHEHATLLLVVENLLDANFEEAIEFRDVGIYPRLGVRARW